jgi:RHH-type transcriptional regulator, proline utilization regulon repressor / proline dehydrogenase / delta 1-pyrroline-5-carboxylate dehydrogenase
MHRFSLNFDRLNAARLRVLSHVHEDEDEAVARQLAFLSAQGMRSSAIRARARDLVTHTRSVRKKKGGVDALMAQYHLSHSEGIALMCLAEALLRVPDVATVDQLIRDKLTEGAWTRFMGKSDSSFVNAATLGLVLTDKWFLKKKTDAQDDLSNQWQSVIQKMGLPVIRKAVYQMMRLLGEQFVMGHDMPQALKRAKKMEKGHYRFSYDMLGEAAMTEADAERYYQAYADAIRALAGIKGHDTLYQRPGISIKLSALYPRYEQAHAAYCVPALTDKVMALVELAQKANIMVTLDAEEIDRRDLSFLVFESVLEMVAQTGWPGFGLAVQAYLKSADLALGYLIDLARKHKVKIPIRLVKGAYWDTEIKLAQQLGLSDYPVYTCKMNTDVAYLAMAKQMLDASDVVYPQFATHNAMTVSAIVGWVGDREDFEFQCLHGMGQSLYDDLLKQAHADGKAWHCRVYAPVGAHKELLPYLVRRLLENGANSSFVHHITDPNTPIESLLVDPVAHVTAKQSKRHSQIPLPKDLYGLARQNAKSFDLNNPSVLQQLRDAMLPLSKKQWTIRPLPLTLPVADAKPEIMHPPQRLDRRLGVLHCADVATVEAAYDLAAQGYAAWTACPVDDRAACLNRAADLLEARMPTFMAMAILEAGKVWQDAVDEVREAVDFLRYYAAEGRRILGKHTLPGPTGERNTLSVGGRGIVVCISPWNFPLAIFAGQVSAALMAGNVVLAKPATQTAVIAYEMVQLLYEAGIPENALMLLPGSSRKVGAPLMSDPRLQGALLTGSTQTAKKINLTLAQKEGPIVPFIAETGGQNVMIVDSSALPEQVVFDVVQSAFQSAGQRCSALRVLFLQEEIADKVETMLAGAMALLRVGDPEHLNTDVGPIIDAPSLRVLQDHEEYLSGIGKLIARTALPDDLPTGHYMAPSAWRIDALDQLKGEVFGPILHVLRYAKDDLQSVLDSVHRTGFGLTLGIHSRIQETITFISEHARVGNIYVNRNMIGAVVGVQPFGGMGLSGTGPKAGGPHYLQRLTQEKTVSDNTASVGGNAALMALSED